MITTKLETITPQLAEKYLKFNTTNRLVRWAHVESLKQDILSNRFLTTHQGIAFGSDGNLYDGQHRLLAIRAAGREVKMLVTRGIEPHVNGDVNLFAMDVIDNGKSRTAADQLNLMHGVTNANLTVAACRIITAVCAAGHRGALTVSRAIPILSLYGEEIEALIKIAGSSKVSKKGAIIGVLALAAKVDAILAHEFMSSLSTGEDIKSGDPVYALREFIISKGVGGDNKGREYFSEVVANAFVNTMKATSIRVIKAGSMGLDFLRSKQRGNVERVRAITLGK